MSETVPDLALVAQTEAPPALGAFLDQACAVKEVVGAADLPSALRARVMADGAARLAPLEGLCQGCPARVRAQPFGCASYIPYPILPEVEEWVLSLLPDNLDSTAGRLLVACFESGPFDGRWLLRWRKDPKRFAVRPSALREWPGRGFYVTSEQVLEPLLFNDAVAAQDTVKLALLFGLLDAHTPYERIRAATQDPQVRRALLAEAAVPDLPMDLSGPPRVQGEALREVLEAVRVAGRINVALATFA